MICSASLASLPPLARKTTFGYGKRETAWRGPLCSWKLLNVYVKLIEVKERSTAALAARVITQAESANLMVFREQRLKISYLHNEQR